MNERMNEWGVKWHTYAAPISMGKEETSLRKNSTDTTDLIFYLENRSVLLNSCVWFRKAGEAGEPPDLGLKVQAIRCARRGISTGKLRFVAGADIYSRFWALEISRRRTQSTFCSLERLWWCHRVLGGPHNSSHGDLNELSSWFLWSLYRIVQC